MKKLCTPENTVQSSRFATLGAAWLACLDAIVVSGDQILDESCALYEIRNWFATIESVDDDAELIRLGASPSRIDLMRRKYASCQVIPPYSFSYGRLLYDNGGVDQIEWVIDKLKRKRETKGATIGLHSPGEDDLSCLSLLDFKVRQSRVEMTAVYRSQDVFNSQPGNVLALAEVQRHVAEEIQADLGSLVLHAMSAHVYEADIYQARRVLAAPILPA